MGRQHGVRTGLTVGAAVLALLAGGCGGSDSDAESKSTYDKKAKTQQIGTAGGECPLPVAFDIPASWKISTPEDAENPPAVGTAVKICGLDARHGGTAGSFELYHQPWQATSARSALEQFVAWDKRYRGVEDVVYRDTKMGPYEAVELSYTALNEVLDHDQKRTQIGFRTPKGLVVIDIHAMDPVDHDALLPEVDRIKDTLKEA
ncbi:lipoprotein [Streptomyces sp. NPDC058953]|uniref:lipoprotein n=1 Tax=unclassified Streptomyces TaxID=2593676 RepID=UPI0036C67631